MGFPDQQKSWPVPLISFEDVTSNLNLHAEPFHVVFQLSDWLTTHKAITKKLLNWSCIEVYVWSHDYKTILSNEPTSLAGRS